MNIKSVLKTLRIFLYKYIFYFVPSNQYIKLQYFFRTRKKLNINNAVTFNEKIQKYKITYRNENMKKCVDKIEVREYVKDKLGIEKSEEILIPLLAYSDTIDGIDFEKLPNKFILKLSNGSSFNQIVTNKERENIKKLKKKFKFFSKAEYYYYGKEWAYKDIRNRFLVEKLLNFNGEVPDDYRFFCFNGEVEFITVDTNSISKGKKNTNYNRNLFDKEWNQIEAEIKYQNSKKIIEKPERLKEMINIAEKLSAEFPHVRVDFYYYNNIIKFGELTFYHASGYQEFKPTEFGVTVGNLFKI